MPDVLFAKRIDGTRGLFRLHLGTCKVLARAPYKGSKVKRRWSARDGTTLIIGDMVPLHRREVAAPCRSCKAVYDDLSCGRRPHEKPYDEGGTG